MTLYLAFKQIIIDLKDNIQALIKILLVSQWRSEIPKLNDKNLIILANGPSLETELDRILEDFGSDHIMVCNLFCKSNLFEELKPKYYVILDPVFQHLDYERAPHIREFYELLFEKVNWEMLLFIPFMNRKKIQENIKRLALKNDKIKIANYNSINFNGTTKLIYRLYGKKLGIPSPANVAIPCIMLGINMNFKRIGILGMELRYHESIEVTEKNEFFIKDVHFYDNQEHVTYQPMYLSSTKNQKMDVSDFFEMENRIFQSLKKVKHFADLKGVTIINYSKKSMIDQFKKVQTP